MYLSYREIHAYTYGSVQDMVDTQGSQLHRLLIYTHIYALCYAYTDSPAAIMGFSVEVRLLYRECESNAFTMGPLTNSIYLSTMAMADPERAWELW